MLEEESATITKHHLDIITWTTLKSRQIDAQLSDNAKMQKNQSKSKSVKKGRRMWLFPKLLQNYDRCSFVWYHVLFRIDRLSDLSKLSESLKNSPSALTALPRSESSAWSSRAVRRRPSRTSRSATDSKDGEEELMVWKIRWKFCSLVNIVFLHCTTKLYELKLRWYTSRKIDGSYTG